MNTTPLADLGYLTMLLDNDSNILHLEWNEASDHLDEDEYKHSAITFRDLVLSHKGNISLVLNNLQKFMFAITPSLQEFIANEIMGPLFSNGLQKMALVLPETIFAQVSTEQVAEEIANANAAIEQVKNFDSPSKAKEWLLS